MTTTRSAQRARWAAATTMKLAAVTRRRPRDAALTALTRDVEPIARSAVDTLEIAVALEVRGINDQQAQADYGCDDVFVLAGRIRGRVELAPEQPAPADALWAPTPVRYLLHGLLYGLPALCSPAVTPYLSGRTALVALVAAVLFSWSLGQGLAFLAYARLGQGDRAGTRFILRRGLVAGLLCLLPVLGAALHVASSPEQPASAVAVLFAAGQAAYMLSATALLVLGAERLLLAVLAPGVLSGIAFLAAGSPDAWRPACGLALPFCAVLAVAAALARTRDGEGKGGAFPYRAAVPHAVFGFLCAALLLTPLVVGRVGPATFAAVLALSVGMGLAELNLAWFRRVTAALVRRSTDLGRFRRTARAHLLVATLRFVAGTAALLAVALLVVTGGDAPTGSQLGEALSVLLIGVAFFAALTTQALGGSPVVLPLMAIAVVALAGAAAADQSALARAFVAALLALGLLADAVSVGGQVSNHA